ncbi:MAG: aminotransferase class V-fold PLP-dependent enzyme, partial [Clostridia bacterium]|nr:aminotransferase class V-fold PLP-dependent enzyme [Clostridia bacterium]
GIKNIYNHEMKLIRRLYSSLRNIPGVNIYTPMPDENYAPVLSFNISGLNSVETASMLNKMGFATRAGLHCAPLAHKRLGTIESGTVRVCPSIFTTTEHIDKFIMAVRNISAKRRTVF